MRQVARVAILLAVLAAVSPAGAQEQDRDSRSTEQSPGALAAEGLEKIIQALDRFVRSIPQYEPPIVTEDGDIIIRRKRDLERTPEPAPPRHEAPPPGSGRGITI